jgi:hypothetical protein
MRAQRRRVARSWAAGHGRAGPRRGRWFWTTGEGKARSHAPDYFARLADGSALVLDVRAADRIKRRDQVAFDATRDACEALGWRYEVAGIPAHETRCVGGQLPR